MTMSRPQNQTQLHNSCTNKAKIIWIDEKKYLVELEADDIPNFESFLKKSIASTKEKRCMMVFRTDVSYWRQGESRNIIANGSYRIRKYDAKSIYEVDNDLFYMKMSEIEEEKMELVQTEEECREFSEVRNSEFAKRQDKLVQDFFYHKNITGYEFVEETYHNSYKINKMIGSNSIGEKLLSVDDGGYATLVDSGPLSKWLKSGSQHGDYEVIRFRSARKEICRTFGMKPWTKATFGVPLVNILMAGSRIIFSIPTEEHDAFEEIMIDLADTV